MAACGLRNVTSRNATRHVLQTTLACSLSHVATAIRLFRNAYKKPHPFVSAGIFKVEATIDSGHSAQLRDRRAICDFSKVSAPGALY